MEMVLPSSIMKRGEIVGTGGSQGICAGQNQGHDDSNLTESGGARQRLCIEPVSKLGVGAGPLANQSLDGLHISSHGRKVQRPLLLPLLRNAALQEGELLRVGPA